MGPIHPVWGRVLVSFSTIFLGQFKKLSAPRIPAEGQEGMANHFKCRLPKTFSSESCESGVAAASYPKHSLRVPPSAKSLPFMCLHQQPHLQAPVCCLSQGAPVPCHVIASRARPCRTMPCHFLKIKSVSPKVLARPRLVGKTPPDTIWGHFRQFFHEPKQMKNEHSQNPNPICPKCRQGLD